MKTYFELREEIKTNELNEGPVGKAIGRGLGMAAGGLAGGIGGGLAGGMVAPGIGNAIGFGAGAIAGGGAGGDIGAKIGDVVSSPYEYAKKGVKALLKKKAAKDAGSNQTPAATQPQTPAVPNKLPRINASPDAIAKWKAKRLAQNNKTAAKPATSQKPGDPMTSKKGGSFLMGVDGKPTTIPTNHPNVAKHRQDILNIVNRQRAALGKGK